MKSNITKSIKMFLLFFILLAPISINATEVLKIGVYSSPPFVMGTESGEFRGMAIDIWKEIAKQNNYSYEFIKYNTIESLINAAYNKEVDLIVTNLTVTHSRAKKIKFSYPWYDAGLRILVHNEKTRSIVGELVKSGTIAIYLNIFIAILLFNLIATIYTRRKYPDFERNWIKGFFMMLYKLTTAARTGKLNDSYESSFGYFAATLWMAFGLAFIAYITSTVTTAMTTASLTPNIQSASDLIGKRVGVFKGSSADRYLSQQDLRIERYRGIKDATKALIDDDVDAVVADAPVLEYWVQNNAVLPISVTGDLFKPEKYAFAGRKDRAELMEEISLELIRIYNAGVVDKIRVDYFGAR